MGSVGCGGSVRDGAKKLGAADRGHGMALGGIGWANSDRPGDWEGWSRLQERSASRGVEADLDGAGSLEVPGFGLDDAGAEGFGEAPQVVPEGAEEFGEVPQEAPLGDELVDGVSDL